MNSQKKDLNIKILLCLILIWLLILSTNVFLLLYTQKITGKTISSGIATIQFNVVEKKPLPLFEEERSRWVPPLEEIPTEEEIEKTILESKKVIEAGELADASEIIYKLINQIKIMIEQDALTKATEILTKTSEIIEILHTEIMRYIKEIPKKTEQSLGLKYLGLTIFDLTDAQEKLTENKKLIKLTKETTDKAQKKELLIKIQELQIKALEKMPEIEIKAEYSEKYITTTEKINFLHEQALEHIIVKKAKNAVNQLKATALKNKGKLTIEKKIKAIEVTNKEITDKIIDRTMITLSISAQEDMLDINIIEIIPHAMAKVTDIIFQTPPTNILQEDPIVQWQVKRIKKDETKKLSYIIKDKKIEKIGSITLVAGITKEEPLFDIKISIIDEYKKVFPGENIIAEISLIKIAGPKVDMNVFYSLIDPQGRIISTKQEVVAVETKTIFVAKLTVPEDAKTGSYIFEVNAVIEEQTLKANEPFEVIKIPLIEKPKEIKHLEGIYMSTSIVLGILFIIFFIFTLIFYYTYKQTKRLTKLMNKITEEDLIKERLIKRR